MSNHGDRRFTAQQYVCMSLVYGRGMTTHGRAVVLPVLLPAGTCSRRGPALDHSCTHLLTIRRALSEDKSSACSACERPIQDAWLST
jgi:hypothetical protein